MNLELKLDIGSGFLQPRKMVHKYSTPHQKVQKSVSLSRSAYEVQQKLLRDIFDHKVDKKASFPIESFDLSQLMEGCRDDSFLDHRCAEDFRLFESITESLMSVVFDEAIEQGFFGLLSDSNKNSVNKVRVQNSRPKNTHQPQQQQIEIPQQEETRKEVLAKKAATEKRKWIVDLASRIKPNECLRVLVVDDTESDRNVIMDFIFDSFNTAVIDEAANGQEAYEKVQANYFDGKRYDMIFMDMNMSVCDGTVGIDMIRLFERRNKISRLCNICAVSADDFEDNPDLAANEVSKIKKPISKEILMRILKKANVI